MSWPAGGSHIGSWVSEQEPPSTRSLPFLVPTFVVAYNRPREAAVNRDSRVQPTNKSTRQLGSRSTGSDHLVSVSARSVGGVGQCILMTRLVVMRGAACAHSLLVFPESLVPIKVYSIPDIALQVFHPMSMVYVVGTGIYTGSSAMGGRGGYVTIEYITDIHEVLFHLVAIIYIDIIERNKVVLVSLGRILHVCVGGGGAEQAGNTDATNRPTRIRVFGCAVWICFESDTDYTTRVRLEFVGTEFALQVGKSEYFNQNNLLMKGMNMDNKIIELLEAAFSEESKQRHTYSFRLDKTKAGLLSLPVLSNRPGSLRQSQRAWK